MKRRTIFRSSIALALAVITAAVMIPLFGDADVVPKPTPTAVDETFDAGTSAMRAYLNPETGQLDVRSGSAPEFQLDAETREALRRDTEGLVEEHHPDGSVSVNLKGRFQNAVIGHIDENGVVTKCTTHAHDVEQTLDEETADDKTPEVE